MQPIGRFVCSLSTNELAHFGGLLCALGYALLSYMANQAEEPTVTTFLLTIAWVQVPVLAVYFFAYRRDERIPISTLFIWAIVFRLIGLHGGPIFEDDFYRYLWDGYRFWEDGTPYGVAPEDFFLNQELSPVMRSVLNQINHPELTTIYGPTNQVIFLLGYLIEPGSLIPLQVFLIVFDVSLIYLLTRLTNSRNVLLYAWCPLVVKEIAFTAHPDIIGIQLVILALFLASNKRLAWAAVCAGMAVGAKIFALVLVPFVLVRGNLRHWLTLVLVLLLLYAPFLAMGGTDLDVLMLFVQEWEFNSALFGVINTVVPSTFAKFTLGLGFAAFWVWYYVSFRKSKSEIPRGDWLFGIFLVVSPVINPWYVLWLLPFAAIYPSRWAWVASIAIFLSYITGLNLGEFDIQAYAQPGWVRPLEFGLIVSAFCWDQWANRQHNRATLL